MFMVWLYYLSMNLEIKVAEWYFKAGNKLTRAFFYCLWGLVSYGREFIARHTKVK